MLIKILLLVLAGLSQGMAAQPGLAEISAHLVRAPVTQGDFRQEKHLKVLRKPLISTGTFTYHQTKGVIWKTRTPVESLLLINETQLVSEQNAQAIPAAFGKVFKAMLGGDLAVLSEGFSIESSEDKTGWQITLRPKDELLKKVISTLSLTGDTEIRRLDIQEASGNSSLITFSHISHPARTSPEQDADFERLSP